MNSTRPLRRDYGISPSLLGGLLILLIGLIALNIFFVVRMDFGASFYSYWLSGRVLFAQGSNPYGAELFEQVQAQFPNDPNISGFTLPLYAVLLVLPFTFINSFDVALVIWMTLLEAALVGTALKIRLSMQIKSKPFSPFMIGLALLLCYYSWMAILDGDIGILTILMLVLALDAIRDNDEEFAGIMLAFALIKYNLTLLPVFWICLWCLRNRHGAVVVWMLLTTGLLSMIAALFMLDWVMEFLRSVVYYYKYLSPMYLSRMIENWQPELGGRIGWAISGFFILVLLIEWFINASGTVDAFEWTLALTLAVGFLVGIPNIGKNLYGLWVPLIYASDKMMLRWPGNGKVYSLFFCLLFLVLPWVQKLLMGQDWNNPVSVLNLIFPAVTFFLLYWNRWWIINTYVDNL